MRREEGGKDCCVSKWSKIKVRVRVTIIMVIITMILNRYTNRNKSPLEESRCVTFIPEYRVGCDLFTYNKL